MGAMPLGRVGNLPHSRVWVLYMKHVYRSGGWSELYSRYVCCWYRNAIDDKPDYLTGLFATI